MKNVLRWKDGVGNREGGREREEGRNKVEGGKEKGA